MTPQQILIVAVRVFAIFWLLTAIAHLVNAIGAPRLSALLARLRTAGLRG